jgi:limonene-1,2-epoxide hydrolase
MIEGFFAMADFRIVTTVAISRRGSTIFTERLDYMTFKDKSRSTLELPLAGVFEVQDGKVKGWREYLDLDTVEEAAGTSFRWCDAMSVTAATRSSFPMVDR